MTKRRKGGTHYTRLLDYLKENKTITSLQAIRDLGNTRLSATIFELRKDGYNISSDDIPVSNRWGGKTMVAEYKLKTHTSVPTQQEDGTTKWVDYYSSDEVNSGIKGVLNKILGK
jgi:hypothetical protein|tara:strand:- start:359 stop:703 length:345 start_codon:yes stop_codon:yes gene_type:complete